MESCGGWRAVGLGATDGGRLRHGWGGCQVGTFYMDRWTADIPGCAPSNTDRHSDRDVRVLPDGGGVQHNNGQYIPSSRQRSGQIILKFISLFHLITCIVNYSFMQYCAQFQRARNLTAIRILLSACTAGMTELSFTNWASPTLHYLTWIIKWFSLLV